MVKVLLADALSDRERNAWEEMTPVGFSLLFGGGEDRLVSEHMTEAHCVVTRSYPIRDVDAGAKLRCIIRFGTNEHTVEAALCKKRSVQVLDVPLRGRIVVAEHVFALLLALAKKIIWAHQSVKQAHYFARGLQPIETDETRFVFNWPGLPLTQLYGLTIGLIGFGEVGRQVAVRAHAFGMNVLYYDEVQSPLFASRVGATYRDMDSLLRDSDVVSLHLPDTERTRRTIGARELAMMKSMALLLNTCRGGVVDEQALCSALADGRIAGAGLDVFEREPLPYYSPLLRLGNVVLTPHIAAGPTGGRRGEISDAWQCISSLDWN